MGRSKLRAALQAEQGKDQEYYKKLKQKKKEKQHKKEKPGKSGLAANGGVKTPEDDDEHWESLDDEEDSEGDDEEPSNGLLDIEAEESDEDEEDEEAYDLEAINDSESSDSEVEMEEKIERVPKSKKQTKEASKKAEKKALAPAKDAEEEEEEDDEESVAMSDLEDLDDEEKEDLIPHTKLRINNTTALLAALNRIAIPTDSSVPFATHQSVVSSKPTAESIEDIQDDLQREVQFYAQSLEAAKKARTLLKAEGVPFSRPNDYFAEMVKDDGHMEKVKEKLVEDATAKKASAEARKLRDLKKFGKQVQVAKLQERQKAKKDTLEKIKALKRKRQESGGDTSINEADLFDVGVESELSKPGKRRREEHGAPNAKRQKKNEKYGFGGKKRHSKSGDAASAGDLSGFSVKRNKSGVKGKIPKTSRLGKSRRKAVASKR